MFKKIQLHKSVQTLLSDADKGGDQMDWFDPKMIRFVEFMDKWVGDAKSLVTEHHPEIDADDSASQNSRRSSKASSTTSSRIRAALLAKAEALRSRNTS